LEEMKDHINETLEGYQKLYDKANLSNIRYFLKGFMDEHKTMVEAIGTIMSGGDFKFPDLPRRPRLDAVSHTISLEDTQVGSLQSILLYICRKEGELSTDFEKITSRVKKDSNIHGLREWQEQIFRKAEHLYADLIEAPSK
ncbi:MAG: hypothetical protein QXV22_05050, partial [Thermoplasmataceae archaeon]